MTCKCGQPLADFPDAFTRGLCPTCYVVVSNVINAATPPLVRQLPLRHVSVREMMRYFDCGHLHGGLRETSQRFQALATTLAEDSTLDGPELTVALRKLLEAKDAAVRSALPTS